MCETKPNVGRLGHLGCGMRGSISCQTKPISLPTRREDQWGKPQPTWSVSGGGVQPTKRQLRKTNPICPPARSGGAMAGASRAKQTQFRRSGRDQEDRWCETKPNLGRAGYVGACLRQGEHSCETKPILGGWHTPVLHYAIISPCQSAGVGRGTRTFGGRLLDGGCQRQ